LVKVGAEDEADVVMVGEEHEEEVVVEEHEVGVVAHAAEASVTRGLPAAAAEGEAHTIRGTSREEEVAAAVDHTEAVDLTLRR
jgi:hypothetical protein